MCQALRSRVSGPRGFDALSRWAEAKVLLWVQIRGEWRVKLFPGRVRVKSYLDMQLAAVSPRLPTLHCGEAGPGFGLHVNFGKCGSFSIIARPVWAILHWAEASGTRPATSLGTTRAPSATGWPDDEVSSRTDWR